jgi:hypothetical protein
MARGPSKKLKPFQKLLLALSSGDAMTIEQIDSMLGKEIYMYRISTYIWHCKTEANAIIRSVKDGRKVVAYQLVNAQEVKNYLDRTGANAAAKNHVSVEKKPSVAKIANKTVSNSPVVAKNATRKTKKVDKTAEVA